MNIIHCTFERHSQDILDILNEAILHTTAIYEYRERSMEQIQEWFAGKARGGFPVLGIEDEAGRLLAFSSYGTFRAWAAFKYSVEHSVYVHHDSRGQGHGRKVLEALIEHASKAGVHVMVGGIDASNLGSIAIHEQLGFSHSGTIRQAGYKFGRWLDLAFYQRILSGPPHPVEG